MSGQQTSIAAPLTVRPEWEAERAATELHQVLRGRVRVREPMSKHTTFRLGGAADVFVQPVDVEDLAETIRFARRHQR